MDISELRKEPHLSASAVTEYLDCSLQYRLRRIDRLMPEFRPDALEFGSVIHKVIAEFHFERMLGTKLSLDRVHSLFEEHWRKSAEGKEDIRYKEGKSFDVLLKEGKALLSAYHNQFPDDGFKVLAIEEPFVLTIDGLSVPFIGVIDLIEEDQAGTIVLSDLKTLSKSYSSDDIDRNFQLTVYHRAVKANGYADREVLLRFDCLIKAVKPRLEQQYTTRTEADSIRAAKKIREVWSGIQKEVFIPNTSSWKCRGCPYRYQCDEWLLK